MANQTAIYQYTWKSGWNIDATEKGRVGGPPSDGEIRDDIKAGIKQVAFAKMAEKFIQLGRWLKVDSVSVDITKLTRTGMPGGGGISDYVEGTTTVVFRSDVTPDEDFAPATGFMGWDDVLLVILGTIITVVLAHPGLFFILLIILALVWFIQSGGLKGVLFGQGGGSLADIGTIIAIGIIGIGGLLLLTSVLGKEKHRGARRRRGVSG